MSDNENQKNQINRILDENDFDNIILYDENDNEIEFEQVAVIPKDKKNYVILVPVTHIDGVGEDEAMIFVIDTVDGEQCLTVVTDDGIIDEVFGEYTRLCDD